MGMKLFEMIEQVNPDHNSNSGHLLDGVGYCLVPFLLTTWDAKHHSFCYAMWKVSILHFY